MGIVAKGAKCDIEECESNGARSISASRVDGAGMRLKTSNKKAVLCKEHYKEWKKETKEDRELERARYDKF